MIHHSFYEDEKVLGSYFQNLLFSCAGDLKPCHTLATGNRNSLPFPYGDKYWITGTGVKKRIRFYFLFQQYPYLR